MNKAILVGNLARDPELRQTTNGVSVCTFTIAVNRKFANAQGVREADFISVVAWRQLADLCGRYLQKGRKVGVVGSIQTRSYDAQDGSKRYVTEVVADDIEFLSPAGDGSRPRQNDEIPLPPEPAASSFQQNSGFQQSSGFQNTAMEESPDDELPF